MSNLIHRYNNIFLGDVFSSSHLDTHRNISGTRGRNMVTLPNLVHVH